MRILKSIVFRWQKTNLMLRILAGIMVGSIFALTLPDIGALSMLGDLFVGALKAIAPVLVAVLVTSSVATARAGLGSRFRTIIALYMLTTLMAAVIAVIGSFLFPVKIALADVSVASGNAPGALGDVFRNIVREVMSNPVTAVAEGKYLSILFWAVVLGLALKAVASEQTIISLRHWADAVSKVVAWIIQCAPFGILGLVYTTVSQSGLVIFYANKPLFYGVIGGVLALIVLIILLLKRKKDDKEKTGKAAKV